MCEQTNNITVGFNLEDAFGNKFLQSSTVDTLESLGETDVDAIGSLLNCFLKQCGYSRKNEYIFMEDVTFEEREALFYFLQDLRSQNKVGEDISFEC